MLCKSETDSLFDSRASTEILLQLLLQSVIEFKTSMWLVACVNVYSSTSVSIVKMIPLNLSSFSISKFPWSQHLFFAVFLPPCLFLFIGGDLPFFLVICGFFKFSFPALSLSRSSPSSPFPLKASINEHSPLTLYRRSRSFSPFSIFYFAH